MTFEAVVTTFEARQSGAGWMARCPGHDDRKASLSLKQGPDGRTLINCGAGCHYTAVLAARGLHPRDLFAATTTTTTATTKAQIVATYRYEDEGGVHLFDVVRFSPKDFRQRRADGAWQMAGVRRVLFGLPELQQQAIVYVPEGEKDALALRAIGLVATTNPGGAGKWKDDYTAQLVAAGVRSVVMLPDHDEPGRLHAEAIARSCHAAGLRVKVVAFPDLPAKADVSDWLAAGHTKADLVALVKATALYAPPAASSAPGTGPTPPDALTLTSLADLLSEPDETTDYVVEDRIPAGSIILFAGKPKAGKSTAARDLTFAIGTGGEWLGHRCYLGPVWYFALEEKRSEVRKHFRLMGATGQEPIRLFIHQAPADIIPQLYALAKRERPAAIVVDTLQRLIKAKDLNDYSETTTKMDPLIRVARDTGAALILLHHSNKHGEGLDAVLGSTALAGSVDNVLMIARTERYRLLSSQQRIGPDLCETIISLDALSGRVFLDGTRRLADEAQMGATIVEALRASTKSLTEPELDQAVEGRTALKRSTLRNLVAREQVSRDGRGGKGDPYRYALPVSCSLVPYKNREQAFTPSLITDSPNRQASDSCSRVPAQEQHDSVLGTTTATDGPFPTTPEPVRERFKL